MDGGWAQSRKIFSMFQGCVALVFVESVVGIIFGQDGHDPVAEHFCDDAGRGNGGAFRISSDDGFLWKSHFRNGESVHQNQVRLEFGIALEEIF